MDVVRFGLAVRALRRRRGWTQVELGRRARCSRPTVSRVERAQGDRLSLRALNRITDALGARMTLRILWQGEELDRLLDSAHAVLVDRILRDLSAFGWVATPEVTFQIGGERGSIDVLAHHPSGDQILVVEVKSVVPDMQATLAGLDRKARLAPQIAADRGWRAASVSRLLVLPDDRTARRRVAHFSATFERAFPARTIDVRRWLRAPGPPLSGVLFLANAPHADARHRVGTRRLPVEHGRASRS